MTTKQQPQRIEVSFEDLLNVLMNVEKGTICSIKTVTEPRMNKGGRANTNQWFGRVTKVTEGNFTCGNSYGDRVRNELKKQGLDPNSYVPEPSKVGEHVSKCVTFNENTGNYCFQLEYHQEVKPKVHYLVDNMSIDDMIEMGFNVDFEQYLVKSSGSRKQEILGIPDTVKLFSPNVKNIKEITLNKVRYVQV